MKRRCSEVLVVAGVSALLLSLVQLHAEDFYYDFGGVYGGSPPISSTTPWMEIVLRTVNPGHVELRVSNLHLTGTENVDQLYFNLNPALKFGSLTFQCEPDAGFDRPRVVIGEDQFKAGGDGRYDVKFSFSSGGSVGNRFTAGDVLVCDVYGDKPFTASDFAYQSTTLGGSTPFYAAAHVQRIGSSSSSGWIYPVDGAKPLPIPEPTSALLWIAGGLALAGLRSWRSAQ